MKTIRYIVAAVVATGMLSIVAPADAKVRDPISRKFQPEKGFFEGKSTTSTKSRPSQSKWLKTRSWNPLSR
ncbi:hypothetical protein VN12_09485 [Pirellula sp. SH-Sr6A]|uniref:hypothetical protein n=1 Tax=Pirellula sp. SH-Sr6A TaxID=1632865 RepID=UPI00078D42CA|nr:hypothetical protein [Pirellula sp. SH-Sr6A]AMV32344.1 hypothetical protein VN12_09485 [Pirellula sp. SH-Sr6A]